MENVILAGEQVARSAASPTAPRLRVPAIFFAAVFIRQRPVRWRTFPRQCAAQHTKPRPVSERAAATFLEP